MAQAVIIMSAKDELANDPIQMKNECKDAKGTNRIKVEAEAEDDPQE